MAEIIIGSEGDLSESLVYSRLILEDDINNVLSGLGEISGGGTGVSGWNIDVEIFDDKDVEWAVDAIKSLLKDKEVSKSTQMGVYLDDSDDCNAIHRVYSD